MQFYYADTQGVTTSQVFSKSFGKVRLFGVRICVELDQAKSLVLSCHVSWVVRVEFGWNSFLVEIRRLADVGELVAGFRFRRVRHDKVTREASPVPSAAHAQEPKTRVVPSGTLLVSLDPAIEFVGELVESPTWRASCRCLPPSLLWDTLSSRVCRQGSTALELDGTRNTKIQIGSGREFA